MTTLGTVAIAAWVLLGWIPALAIARLYAIDPKYGAGETGFVFVGTWALAPLVLPFFIAGWLTIKAGEEITTRFGEGT